MNSLKFLADENFSAVILRGLLRKAPDLDIIRVQDEGLASTDDRITLEWAAKNGRVLLTHDIKTMPNFAYERVADGLQMAGIIVMKPNIQIGTAIDDILLIYECLTPAELENGVLHIPV
jgi:hypothetical protein